MIRQCNLEPMYVEIYYSSKEIMSLRWLTEIKNEMRKYDTAIHFKIYDLDSEEARRKRLTSESIIFNDQKIILQQLRKLIFDNRKI